MAEKRYILGMELDQLRRDKEKAKSLFSDLGRDVERTGKQIDGTFLSIGKVVAGLGAGFAFEEMARQLYNFSQQFNKSMLEVSTISQTVTNDMDGFKEKILELTTEVPIGADEAAKALYQIVSAGHDGAAGMNVLEVAAKAAVGGVTQTATAADAITSLLNAYKLSADEAETVSDKLFTTVRLGKTDWNQLGTKIAGVAPLAANFGIEMEQVLAAVATLTASGTPTAEAVTQIRASIVAANKVLGDGAFKTRTLQEGLAEIAEMAGGSESKLKELVPEIEAMNGVLGMTGLNAQKASEHLAEFGNIDGASQSAFVKTLEDSNLQLTMLKNNALATFSDLGDGIMASAGNIAKYLNEAFESGNIERTAKAVMLLITTLGTYRATMIATQKIKLFTGNLEYATMATELQKIITVKEQIKNADLAEAISKGKLSVARAEEIAALRAEGEAKLANLRTSQAEAKIAMQTAVQAKEIALERALSAERTERAALNELSSAQSLGNAEKIKRAEIKLTYAQEFLDIELKKDKIAQNNLDTATTQYNSAATATNTLQQNINTASVKAGTTAKSLFASATGKVTSSIKAMKLAFASNPIGLLITVLTTAATAWMMFKNNTDAAAGAIKGVERANQSANEEFIKQEAHIKALQSTLENGNAAYDERKKALDDLNKVVPNYNASLDSEGLLIKGNTTAMNDYIASLKQSIYLKAAQGELEEAYIAQRKAEQEIEAKIKRGYTDYKGQSVGWGGGTATTMQFSEEEAEKMRTEYMASYNLAIDKLNQEIADRSKKIGGRTTDGGDTPAATLNYGEEYQAARKAWEEAKKELKEVEDDRNKFTTEVYNNRAKAEAEAKKKFEALGGSTSTKSTDVKQSETTLKAQTDAHNAEMELRRSQLEERIELEGSQSDARLELIRFDRDRELAEIEKNRQAYLKAGGTKGDDGDQAFQKQKQVVRQSADNEINALNTENQKAEALAMQNYLKEYGTFQQRKLAITQEYAAKIAKVEEGSAQAMLLTKERDSALADVETESIKMQIDWQTVFGNVGGLLSDAVKPTLEEAKKYLNTDEFKNASEDSKQVLIEAIQQLEASIGSSGGLNFKQLGEDVNAYQESLRNLMDAKQAEIDAYDDLAKAQKAYKDALKDGTKAEIESAETAMETAQTNAETASSNVESATTSSKEAQDKMRETAEDTQNKMSVVTDSIQKFSTGGLKNAFEGITGLMKALGGTKTAAGKLAEQLDIPIISWILGLLDALQDGIGPIISGLIDSIFGAINGILSNILSGELFVQVGKSLWDGVTGLFESVFTLGGVFDYANKRNEALAKEIEYLNKLVDVYDDLISRQSALVSQGGDIGQQAYDDAIKLITGQQEAANKSLTDWFAYGADWNSHSNGYKYEKYYGDTLSRDQILSMTGSQWEEFYLNNAEFWAKIPQEVQDYGILMMDSASQAKDLATSLAEALNAVSIDDIKNELSSILNDFSSDLNEAGDSWDEFIMKIVNSSITSKFSGQITKLTNMVNDAFEDDKFSTNEAKSIQDFQTSLYAQMAAERDSYLSMLGIETDFERTSTSSGIATASQESVDENNGRLTAIQGHTFNIAESVMRMRELAELGAAAMQPSFIVDSGGSSPITSSIGDDIQNLRNNAGKILTTVMGIKDDTAHLDPIRKDIASVKTSISNIEIKGLKLKV